MALSTRSSLSPRGLSRAICIAILATTLAFPLTLLAPRTARAALGVGGSAVVITTEGDRLTVRSGPGVNAAPIGSLAEGTVVTVIGGPQTSADGLTWFQVQGGGLTGWCSAEWLAEPGAAPPPAPAPQAAPAPAPPSPTPAPAPLPAAPSGANPHIAGTGGKGARLRDAPSLKATILLVIPEGEAVAPTGASKQAEGYEWTPVRYKNLTGWVASSLLTASTVAPSAPPAASPPPPAPAPAPTPAPAAAPAPAPAPAPQPATTPTAGQVAAGDRAQVVDTDGYPLRIRSRPGLDAPIVTVIPPASILLVTGGPQADSEGAPWFGVDYNGVKGWVLGEHLARTGAAVTAGPAAAPPAPSPAPTAAPAPSVAPSPSPARPSPSPSAAPAPPAAGRGPAVVAEALKYLGVPYLYGGATPAGWDCSGFVLYVYQHAAGIALPRSAAQQYRVGATVAANAVQAGDIVFFADTFGPGITHNGIALGDGRFIHARSEGYGTVISSLADPYWAQHYAGARRP